MLLPEKCCALTRNDDNGNDVCMWGWENTWPLQPPARPLSSVVPWAFSWTSNDPLISSSGLIILFDPASNVILLTNCVFQMNRLFADHVNRVMIVSYSSFCTFWEKDSGTMERLVKFLLECRDTRTAFLILNLRGPALAQVKSRESVNNGVVWEPRIMLSDCRLQIQLSNVIESESQTLATEFIHIY